MNTYQLIESIRQVFPNLSKNQIRLDIDSAQKLLLEETGALIKRASLLNPSQNVAWALPDDFSTLKELLLYNQDNSPVYIKELGYKYEIEFNKLFVYSGGSEVLTGLACDKAYIVYSAIPQTLANESTNLEIKEAFVDTIEHYVLGKYFGKFPIEFISGGQVVKAINLSAAQFHINEYEKKRIKLKKLMNSLYDKGGEVIRYPHAGSFYLSERPLDIEGQEGGDIMTAAQILSTIYKKYAYFKIADNNLTNPIIAVGYTNITAQRVDATTVVVTSASEFETETIIIPNNMDATWEFTSTSQITFTIPSDTILFSFEIYERD